MYNEKNMKKKILLIDDSPTQLASLKLLLFKSGHEVVTATNGAEGISVAYQHLPDLIVSDILMPEINGYQVCRLLKSDNLTKNIPIILLTCLNEKLDKFWGLRAGADAFITKEDDFSNIVDEINKFLTSNNEISQEIRKRLAGIGSIKPISLQSRINQLLDQSLIESTLINEFRNLSEYVTDLTIMSKGVLSLISSILDCNVAGIFFNDRDEKKEKKVYCSIYDISSDNDIYDEVKKDFFSTLFPEDYEICESLYNYELFDEENNDVVINNVSEFQSREIVPIIYAGTILGGICLYHKDPNKLNFHKFNISRIFNIILQELKILMRIRWLYSETKYLAITDALSGLYNRRYMLQALEREFARSKRYKKPLSVVMFDIDHFKKVNDSYGHQFGDKVIQEVSKTVKTCLRKTDYVARYGGEEILAILPETSIEKAIVPIERLRKTIEEIDFEFEGKPVRVTISIGVASISDNVKDETELVSRADQALYNAKENGRNRVELYLEE